jgi:hypothetical protein
MRRRLSVLALPLLAGCGYVGAPLPPALNIPQRVTDLSALQRGDEVVLRFTPPMMSTDDLPLKELAEFEVRAGAAQEAPFDLNRWVASAEKFTIPFAVEPIVEHRLASSQWVGREVVFAVRAIGPTGRGAEWSNLRVLTIVPGLPRAVGLASRGTEKGVYLTWKADPLPDGASWGVWRRAETAAESTLLGLAKDPSWLDTQATPGLQYSYWVQAALREGSPPAEGRSSEIISVVYRDEFPPGPPAGLTAIAGLNGVELAWERNVEGDLAGYQIYRALGDGAFEKLGAPVPLPVASDSTAESGKRYRYAVAAVDSAGNVGKMCEPVEIVAPEKP